jgi:hypothetical protein
MRVFFSKKTNISQELSYGEIQELLFELCTFNHKGQKGINRTLTSIAQLFFRLENGEKWLFVNIFWKSMYSCSRLAWSTNSLSTDESSLFRRRKKNFKSRNRYQLKIIEKRSFIDIFHSADDHSTKDYTDSTDKNC